MGTSHPLSVTTNNHAITGVANYADIAARDADTAFHSVATNVDKVVRINSPISYYILISTTPTWSEFSSEDSDEWTELSDTPSAISANLNVQGNSGGTALEFGQNLNTTGSPTFTAITIGSSVPFADSAGTLTLQNIDVLDSTTESTIESAIDTLANLTSIQGQTVSFSGALTVESTSIVNQDLTTDANVDFSSLELTGSASSSSLTLSSTTGAVLLNRLTTTQRDALTGAEGHWLYNTTITAPQYFNGSAWVSMGSGDVFLSGTPVDNQVAIWTGASNIEGDANFTFDAVQLKLLDGTELLPAYSFLNDAAIGMRRVSSNILGFSARGFDVLHLTAAVDADHYLQITARETGFGDDGILIEPIGVTTDIPIDINSKGGGPINLNVGAAAATVAIGRSSSSDGLAIFDADGGIAFGSYTIAANTDGRVLSLRALAASFTRTEFRIESPNAGAKFDLGINNPGVNNGDAFLTTDGTELVFNTSAGEALSISSLQVAVGSDTPLTDLTIFQKSGSLKGITLSGVAISGSSTTEGVSLLAGNIGSGNNQFWIVNTVDQGNAAKNSFRFLTGQDVPLIVGVNNTNTTNRNLCFGINALGAGAAFGFPTNAAQADVKSKVHIKTGVAAEIGFIVQAATSQTADLLQIMNSGGTATSAIDASDNWGIGLTSPTEKLHVSGNAIITGDLTVDTDTLFVDASANRVGFGLTDPDNAIHVDTGNIHVGAKNDAVGTRVILSPNGNVEMTFGLNDGSPTPTAAGRYLILFNSNAIVESGNDTGAFLTRNNGGRWGAMSGSGTGSLRFFTDGTSTDQAYDPMSATFAMEIDENQNVAIGVATALAKVHIDTTAAGTVGLITQGVTSQTADLFQAKNVGDTVVASINVNGDFANTGLVVRVKWKEPVRVATIINGTLATAFENGDTVDGIVLATNDRLLLKNQTTGSENGIYIVNASGAPTRSTDFDGNTEVVGSTVQVLEGTVNTQVAFKMTNTGAVTVGTTALVFKDLNDRPNFINIRCTNDWGTLETAPDGEQRLKLVSAASYFIHADHTIPLMWLPEIPTPEQFAIIDFRFINSSVLLLCEAGDTAGAPAQIWGRNMGALLVQEGNFVDVGNSEAGLVTTLFDLVGVDANSLLALQFTLIFGFKKCGHTVDVFHDHTDSLFQDNVGGFVVKQNAAVASDNLVRAVTFRHSSGVAFDKPVYTFLGSPNTNQIVNSTIDLLPNQDFICLDSALSSATEIVANPYPGASKGDFFSTSSAIAITTQAADNVSFASVAAGAAGFSVITFAAIQDFTRGQIVLIKGDTGTTYDGLQTITAVSDDQMSFTINVTFIATDTGDFQMVQHTVASHPFVRDGTIVITDTTNNGTFKILRETDTTFNTPALFAAGDLIGTATNTPLDVDTVGVKTLSNGAQRDSIAIGAMAAIGNATATTISTINTWTDLDLNAGATSSTNNSRYTLTNTTTGEQRYDDVNPIVPTLVASISCSSTGGTQEFEFRVVVNGSPTSDVIVVSAEIGSDTVNVVLQAGLSVVQNDLVRVQVQNIDGTSNITIKNLIVQVKI